MKLSFKDGQTLQAQSISASDGALHVNILNNCYEQLKHLFTDPVATARIEAEDGEVYENYTVFSFIRENAGGIWIVEMQQEGKDTSTRLAEAERQVKDHADELTATQMALCEVYELLEGVIGNG